MVGDSFLGIHVFYPFQKIVVVLIQYTSYQHLEKPVHSPHNASHLESHFDVVTSHKKSQSALCSPSITIELLKYQL